MPVYGFLPSAPPAAPVELDRSQRAVLELPEGSSGLVIGAPGTGKTTTLVELAAARVADGFGSGEILGLAPTRGGAARLRDLLERRVGASMNGPMARSTAALAFDIVGHAARASGSPVPILLTGADQDSDIAALLAGQLEDGTGPLWPQRLGPEVRALAAFRTELRELLMRTIEYDIPFSRVRELGIERGRDEWVAAADFLAHYLEVVSSARPHQLDSVELVRFAVAALARDEVAESVRSVRLVLVDDLQDATVSTLALLAALARRGAAVVAFGDPDVAANSFRGGVPDAVGRLGGVLGVGRLPTLPLAVAHRHGTELRGLTSRVTERIGTAGVVGHRGAASASDAGDVVRVESSSPARQWNDLARLLRERHVHDGVPWSEMAVVLRSGRGTVSAARALAAAGVPIRTLGVEAALGEQFAVRNLLDVVELALEPDGRTPLRLDDALLGPFGGIDRLGLRRLRLALRAEELAGGGTRTADELLVEAIASPSGFATIDHRAARAASRFAETLDVLRREHDSGATVEELLWTVWDRSGLAAAWAERALRSGAGGEEADRRLDEVLALFTAAARFVERDPDSGPGVFLSAVREARLADDTLAPRAATDAVLVATPPGVVGLEFDTVAVASVQEGSWPDLRTRGSLLGPHELVRAARGEDGPIDARREVLADELRLFALAVSRSRQRLIVSAVASDDEAPSPFLALLPADAVVPRPAVRAPLTLRGITGVLRRRLTEPGSTARERRQAASALALLAREGVRGASPDEWHGLADISTHENVYADEETVRVSPSKLEAFEDSAADWFIDWVSGGRASEAMALGNVLHWAMENTREASEDAVWEAVEQRWGELVFEAPWVGERQRQIARGLAAALADYLSDAERDGVRVAAAEPHFSLSLGRAVLDGAIDRVEVSPDGGVVIVDLKTGAPITNAQRVDDHAQLRAYQLAYAEGALDEAIAGAVGVEAHQAAGARLLFVKEGKGGKRYRVADQRPLGGDELEAFRERVRDAAEGMAGTEFGGPAVVSEWGSHDAPLRALHRAQAVCGD